MKPFEFRTRYLQAQPAIPPDLNIKPTSFEVFDKVKLSQAGLVQEDIEFLSIVGLPQDSPPFLSFFAVDVREHIYWLNNIPYPDKYFVIGNNGHGEPIVLDKTNRQIMCFNHDDDNKKIFVNSNLQTLMSCLCVYVEHFYSGRMETFHKEAILVDRNIELYEGFWYDN